ncbi:MAG TPA: helix-turn-helix domain-containing protein [Sandaracinaceae bacterium LLY-WYZ-13_1]|nr:helix-turn-helix domain-containing protein [Sandaracinaceae bacterium LLY-WYZ-13_1]
MSQHDLGPELPTDDLLTTSEAADALGVSPTSIKRWADAGRLPAQKTAGGHRRYRRGDVEHMRRQGEEEPHINGFATMPARQVAPHLPDLTRPQLDALPFGVIQLSDDGTVLLYNATESRFSGIGREHAEGKHFFGELAPCCNNRLVYGRFKEGLERGKLDVQIDYTFTYRMRPTNVRLHLYRDDETRSNWLTVTPV